jgi:tRNA modification GTPase
MPDTATIFALASGIGRAGVAVVRVSGPAAGEALRRLAGRDDLPPPRKARRADFYDGDSSIDRGLSIWFPAPASFTGEDVVELHVHGGPAVIRAICDALARIPGLRPADPGEFSRRAFQHGKMDLTEAEGLADLVDAETEAQRRQALRQMEGALGRLYETWRGGLVAVLARLEAELDFPDEADVPPDKAMAAVMPVLAGLEIAIATHLADGARGERLRDGLSIAILGPPNAGKSSLLNVLAKRDAAIVSAIAGTTRDVLECHLDLGGFPVVVADTAGLREAGDPIEAEGVRRAKARGAAADLKLIVVEAGGSLEGVAQLIDRNAIVVVNKIDLKQVDLRLRAIDDGAPAIYPVSVKTGAGLAELLHALTAEVRQRLESAAIHPALTRARHRAALEECRAAIGRALAGGAPELVAEDVRLAARALGRITGRVDVEDVLDVVFREFCIGK